MTGQSRHSHVDIDMADHCLRPAIRRRQRRRTL